MGIYPDGEESSMITVMSVAGKHLYKIKDTVATDGHDIVVAQAKLRYFVYHIVPERIYTWLAKADHGFACIR